MKNLHLIFVLAAVLLGLNLNARDFDKARMDSLFSLLDENNKGMGSISLFQNGEEVYQNSFGFASIEHNQKSEAATRYRIGSISKTFTATIILKLIEQNQLTLNTSLSKFFPQIKDSEKITIEHLLRHRSGIFNITQSPDYLTYHTQAHSRDQLVNKIASFDRVFEPGEKAAYSNSNYILLTFIAEEAGEKSYSTLLDEFIAKPCGLNNTYVGTKSDIAKNEASSYKWMGQWKIEEETDMSIPQGAGAVVSTPADLNLFLNCLFNGKLLTTASLEAMKTFQDGFGLGLFQVPFYERQGIGHNGGIDGFLSSAFYFPEDNFSVALCTNGLNYPVNDILIGALSIYFGKDYDLPAFKEPLVLKSEDLDQYVGLYSSPSIPLKLTIFKNDNVLMGQGSGQPAFPLEAVDIHQFKFDQANLTIEFQPEDKSLKLVQGGREFIMTKEQESKGNLD
jgi:D-alanyl-D-alanine carboxypeptidase